MSGLRQGKGLFLIVALPVAFSTLYFSRDQFLPQVSQQVNEAFPEEDFEKFRESFQDFGQLIIRELFSDADSDSDGLSNKLELLLQSDPEQADSDDDGYPDGIAFKQGVHPVTGSLISDKAVFDYYQQILEQYPSVREASLPVSYTAARLKSDFLAGDVSGAEKAVLVAFAETNQPEFFEELLRELSGTASNEHALLVANLFVEQYPEFSQAYASRGFLYHSQGKLDSAKADYLKTIQEGTLNPFVWNNLGLIYYDTGNLTDAIQAFQAAVDLQPSNAVFQEKLSQIKAEEEQLASQP